MKNVLLTGASKGIGKALAIEFAKSGFNLCLLARNTDKLESLSNSLKDLNIKVFFMKCDVTEFEDVNKSVQFAYENLGGIDIAILNAGVAGSGYFENFDSKNLKDIYDVNVFGVTHFLELLIPKMKNQNGSIIAAVSSLADARGIPGNAAYCSSKAALTQILEAARIELKPYGINIVTIRPGFIKTDMTAKNTFYMPFLMETTDSAKIIVKELLDGKERIAFPNVITFLSYIGRALPSIIFEKIITKRKKPINE